MKTNIGITLAIALAIGLTACTKQDTAQNQRLKDLEADVKTRALAATVDTLITYFNYNDSIMNHDHTVMEKKVAPNLHQLNQAVVEIKQAQDKEAKLAKTTNTTKSVAANSAKQLSPPLIYMADGSQLPGHPVQLTGTPIAANAIDPPAGLKARDEYSAPPAQPLQTNAQPQPTAAQPGQTNMAQPALIEVQTWPAK